MKIAQVTETVFVSGHPCFSPNLQEDLAVLNKCHLILDVRELDEGSDGWHDFSPVEHKRVVMYDDGRKDNTSVMFYDCMAAICDYAEEHDMLPLEVKVMVHCHMGINRSPSVAMFLLMAVHGMEPQEAFFLIRAARTIAFVGYATEAVEAWADITGIDTDVVSKEWQAFQADYWTPHEQRRINAYIKLHNSRGTTFTDEQGRLHATGKK